MFEGKRICWGIRSVRGERYEVQVTLCKRGMRGVADIKRVREGFMGYEGYSET